MSSSIKCSDHHSDHMTAVAPTAKVRATFSNVLEPDSVPSSAAPQYADAIVEDCTGTDMAFCGSYCRGDDPSLAAAATEDATAVLNQTRLTPESILASTAPEEAAPILTDKPAAPGSCWSPTHLGSDYCWHDTENRMCGEGEAGCSCICRKCPDGYMEDHSNPGTVRCSRCPPGLQNLGGLCFEQCPAGTAWKWQYNPRMFGCFTYPTGGDRLGVISVQMSTTCSGGAIAFMDTMGGVKCYTACPADKPQLETSHSHTMVRRRLFHATVGA